MERERLEVDVVIVGGGPAGMSAALHLVAEAERRGIAPPAVALLEKAPEPGAHSLSGAVLDPRALDRLMPQWRRAGAPVEGEVGAESMLLLTPTRSFKLPWVPAAMRHHGCCVVSLQKLVAWLGQQCEAKGVNLFAGFSATALLMDGQRVCGVRTGDRGVDKRGQKKGNFEPGVDVVGRITLIADGVRGNLSQPLIRAHRLDADRNPQIYAGGAKEVWRLPAGRVPAGTVIHTLGWPLGSDTFGGAFLYGMREDLVSLGLVVGLDSPDPRVDVQERLQAVKTHPVFRPLLAGGELVAYGAKAIPEGGYWAMPRMAVDGALLLGDAAGLVNAMRLKGIHLAMESGMAAAEVALDALAANDVSAAYLSAYERRVKDGPAGQELFSVRNFRQAYQQGLWRGMLHTGLQFVSGGRGIRERYPAQEDHHRRQALATFHEPIQRVAPDGKLTFDRMTDVYNSATRHEENQPPHLVVLDPELCRTRCRTQFGNPCERFCPAGVYEMVAVDGAGAGAGGDKKLQINFSNCVHCKICDIADPYGVILWTPPEGGEGPRYRGL